jgi:hypothetical protein
MSIYEPPSRATRRVAAFGLLALAPLAFYPLFFVVFRLSVFSTVPTDDYAPYLLWVLQEPGGGFPLSPYCYRFLSMVAAAPLYYVLPKLDLSNLPESLSPTWIRATAALSALAYVSMVGTMLTTAVLAVRKCGLSLKDGLLAGMLVLLLLFYTQITAIDPLAVFAICLGLLLLDRTWAFAGFTLISAGVNEKIALTLAVWLTVRWVLAPADRARFTLPWISALAGVGAHLAIVLLLRFPGHEYQLRPSGFLGTLADNLQASISMRGILLNILPALVLATIGGIGHLARSVNQAHAMFHPIDLLAIPSLMGVALIFTQQFQTGRLLMHAAPLFVLPFVAGLQTFNTSLSRCERHSRRWTR